ncbi:hypothetical protein C4D60_Mb03t08700 [Musa balbisiana]|uniref:Bidirectional sugar transporter SWEET n=1 Tax=Musa balbisiana TaxID=52838 RepID=A0A4S8J8H1_MUSBA|nr:hypothetical protein C4D60_Mb03t08700 [Musa balbisiana]
MLVITIVNPFATAAGLLVSANTFGVSELHTPNRTQSSTPPLLTPTFYRIYKKKSTESFDSVPYVVALFSAMLWVYYGLLTLDVLLLTINTGACIIEMVYLTIYLIYASKKPRAFTLKLISLVNVGIYGSLVLFTTLFVKGKRRIDVTGWICASFAVSVFAAPLSIIRLVIRTKSVEYMPFSLSFFLTLSAVAWFGYGILLGDLFVAVSSYLLLNHWSNQLTLPNVVGFMFGIAQIIIYFMYVNSKKAETLPKLNAEAMPAAATPDSVVELPEKKGVP